MSASNIDFNTYQILAEDLAIYPDRGHNLTYVVLGLVGEAGEVADKVKRIVRDHDGMITRETRDAIISEIGDVLWYAAGVLTELGANMGDCAQGNIEKLESRRDRGKIKGSGDDR